MAVFSLVCSALPVSGDFGNVNSSFEDDGVLISWDYWGPEKSIYIEYKIDDSKRHTLIFDSST